MKIKEIISSILLVTFLLACSKSSDSVKESVTNTELPVAKTATWNLTKNDFNKYDVKTVDELYIAVAELKSKSNSSAMNDIFQAVLNTKPIEEGIREEIIKNLNNSIPNVDMNNAYNYGDKAFNTPSKLYKVVTEKGLLALDSIASNLEMSYKRNESVSFDKQTLSDGYNIIVTPAHYKAMCGAFKIWIAQLNFLSSFKFENDNDANKFFEMYEKLGNGTDEIANITFLRDTLPTLNVLSVNRVLQLKALKYMNEGTQELLDATNSVPVMDRFVPEKQRENVLSIEKSQKEKLITSFTLLKNLLKNGGGQVEILKRGQKINTIVDLSKFYTLDIKAILPELLKDTKNKSGIDLDNQLRENMVNSTLGGIFPNKIPRELLN